MKPILTLSFLALFSLSTLFSQAQTENYNILPNKYLSKIKESGTIERVDYSIKYNEQKIDKHLYVYLPYNYNTEIKYNTLYLMHGGMGSPETMFGGVDRNSSLKIVLDNMHKNKDITPTIVVSPTYYNNQRGNDGLFVKEFQKELRETLIPLIDSKYSTFKLNQRDHRAFGGFSMGSVTTWYTFTENIDNFKYFIPMSGDSWIYTQMGGSTHPKETVDLLEASINGSKYLDDFYIYGASGTNDIAFENEFKQIEEMKKRTNTFNDTNLFFLSVEGETHDYTAMNKYLYNALPIMFN